MAGQKRRTAWSVQDVANGVNNSPDGKSGAKANPRFKSGYSGPKKSQSSVSAKMSAEMKDRTGRIPSDEVERLANKKHGYHSKASNRREENMGYSGASQAGNGHGVAFAGSGILDYAWIAFAAILGLCVTISLCMFSASGGKIEGYRYPTGVFTFGGVVNQIFDDYKNGGLGSDYIKQSNENLVDKDNVLGGNTTNTSALPNTTTGATMAIDTGSTYGSYNTATSHEELIQQLKTALEANDFGFVGMKLAYQDENSGDLIGYPQSVVEHFTNYMSENIGKREVFLTEISDASTYSVKNGSAYVVKLPILKFTINMGYDNTNVSISGFSDQKMDAGQSAVVSPLLPCMYTITVTTDDGSQSSEVECDMGEGNLQVNIGVTN